MEIKAISFLLCLSTLAAANPIQVKLRERLEDKTGAIAIQVRDEEWIPSETAVIVCDMWDSHHCLNAVKRVGEVAPRMDLFIKEIRKRGGMVIHAPSSCTDYYRESSARKRALNAPKAANLPEGINSWLHWKDQREEKAGYPIDHSDGGEDDDPKEHADWAEKLQVMGRNPRSPWVKQIDAIYIDPDRDAITDSGEENWNILEQGKIKNVMLVGVHTNMCVLGRPFGLRQLAKNGKNVVLVRDLTDTMYNPKMFPKVNHFTGTDLIIEHIEKYVCPTITSDQILGGESFVFKHDDRPKIVFLIGEQEYSTRVTVPAYAEKNLAREYRLEFHFAEDDEADFGDLNSALKEAELLFVSVRRRALPAAQLSAVKRYIKEGNPVVGIRTASHAFSLRGKTEPEGSAVWENFDSEVFGGNYHGHHGSGHKTSAKATEVNHPVLVDIGSGEFSTGGSLYQVLPLEKGTTVLLEGRAVGVTEKQPVAWVNDNVFGGKSFYTSLGHVEDFKKKEFVKMLNNAVAWLTSSNEASSKEKKSIKNAGLMPKGALKPLESLKRMNVPKDLSIDLVLNEPIVRQPLHLSFDARGRLWVVQYIQYPNPAGLKQLSRDKVWRVAYDRTPPPPPHPPGSPFRGKDRISIHEDTNGDGVFDKHKVFVDGLNMATSVAHDVEGIWVTNPPYLLYYPDRDRDDVPDGDPIIHLKGFGLEDSHSIANSLLLAPDGWLYGAQGSTVSAAITLGAFEREGVAVKSMGQNIWRYHPKKHVYEIFAEGGGNAFGLEMDSRGRIFSGHNGGDTRGFHYVQGAYYRKSWGKHGALTNEHAYGYFPSMKNVQVSRFTHQFIIYEDVSLPERYRGKLFGVDVLHNDIVLSNLFPDGSTFQTKDIERVVSSKDPWFRPVMVTDSPDGSIYIADWYDRQVNHYKNHEGNIDHELGRIYRIRSKDKPFAKSPDLRKLSAKKLLENTVSASRWLRRASFIELSVQNNVPIDDLVKKSDPRSVSEFEVIKSNGQLPNVSDIKDAGLRGYAVRRITDENLGVEIKRNLISLAKFESSPEVVSQLISSVRKIDAATGLAILEIVASRDEFINDPHIPLLIWWAIEPWAINDVQIIREMFGGSTFWDKKIVRKYLLQRLMRRYASEETRNGYGMCAFLLNKAPDKNAQELLVAGFSEANKGRQLSSLPLVLMDAFQSVENLLPLPLRLRINSSGTVKEAIKLVGSENVSEELLIEVISTLGWIGDNNSIEAVVMLLQKGSSVKVEVACLAALAGHCSDARILEIAFNKAKTDQTGLREAAIDLLASEKAGALFLLQKGEAGEIRLSLINAALSEKLRAHGDNEIDILLAKLLLSAREKISSVQGKEITKIKSILEGGGGNPKLGEKVFMQRCMSCHQMFGNGGSIGPSLTSYQRHDEDSLLLSIVVPGAEIREGFENTIIRTKTGEIHSGFLVEETSKLILLRELSGATRVLPKDALESIKVTGVSLMPPGLLSGLNDTSVKDLFAFLRSTTPPF